MGPVRQNPIHRTVSLFICVCIALCTIVAHNIAQNRPDSFPSYPPDNHHCSDDVYLREGGGYLLTDVVAWLTATRAKNKQMDGGLARVAVSHACQAYIRLLIFCIVTQQTATFLGVWTEGWGLLTPNSNSGKIFAQCTKPPSFTILGLIIRTLSC